MVVAGISAAASLAGAVGGIVKGSGSGANSTTQQQTTDSSHTPLAFQQGALSDAMSGATSVYNDRTAAGPYTGALYTGLNAWQTGAAQQGVNVAGQGIDASRRTDQIGMQGQGALGQSVGIAGQVGSNGIGGQNGALTGALQNTATGGIGAQNGLYTGTLQGISGTGIGQQNGALMGALQNVGTGSQPVVNGALSTALTNGAVAGANAIGDYNRGLSGVLSSAMADPTQQLASSAQTYMNSGATQGMLDNVNSQIDATLNESTVPGLNRQAALGGGLNSSRAGMAEAMANRDAALAKGNADAQILNNAYNTGLSTAASQRTAGLNTAAGAASAGLTDNSNLALGAGNQQVAATNAQVNAANSGLSQGTNFQTADTSARLSAANNGLSQDTAHQTADAAARTTAATNGLAQNTSYQSADAAAKLGAANALNAGANTAVNANTAALNQGTSAVDLFGAAGGLLQQDSNAQNQANYQQWQLQNGYQQNVLDAYMKNATAPQGFYQASTASSGSTTPPSALPSLIAGAGTALGSQAAPGGLFSSTNKDGTPNPSYIGNWFTGGSGGSAGNSVFDQAWSPGTQ